MLILFYIILAYTTKGTKPILEYFNPMKKIFYIDTLNKNLAYIKNEIKQKVGASPVASLLIDDHANSKIQALGNIKLNEDNIGDILLSFYS